MESHGTCSNAVSRRRRNEFSDRISPREIPSDRVHELSQRLRLSPPSLARENFGLACQHQAFDIYRLEIIVKTRHFPNSAVTRGVLLIGLFPVTFKSLASYHLVL